MERKYRAKQASDSLLVGVLLSASGGLQDAYTYHVRDHVFANAQTGNIVLMAEKLTTGQWAGVVRYLLPLLAFAGGVLLAELLHRHFHTRGIALHWRHGVLLTELLLLIAVAFFPQSLNVPANILVSFACAMQVEAFREVEGNAYATTMCIGNLRSGTENLFYFFETKDRTRLHRAGVYYAVIAFFLLGAALGGIAAPKMQEMTILLCCPLLLAAAALMLRIRSRHLRFLALMTGAEEEEKLLGKDPGEDAGTSK